MDEEKRNILNPILVHRFETTALFSFEWGWGRGQGKGGGGGKGIGQEDKIEKVIKRAEYT